MIISKIIVRLLLLIVPAALLGQTLTVKSADKAAAAAEDKAAAPKLEHFDPAIVDRSLNPCDDFYKFACGKWIAANPIPADQVYWSTGSGLQLWNENVLRETLEASKNELGRNAVQQKIGDYWAACMDLSGIEAAGLKPLQPQLDRIAAIKSKSEIAAEIAHLHQSFPDAWEQSDNQSDAPFFGFTGKQDYDDASKVVAAIDQGGLSLPSRDYYLNSDEKSQETLKKYHAHIQKMFVLAEIGRAHV